MLRPAQEGKLKILHADDHVMFRDGIQAVISQKYPDVQLLGAGTVADAMDLLIEHEDVDLIFLDLDMPGMEYFIGLNAIRQFRPQTLLIVLSESEKLEDMRECLEAGVQGFVHKSESGEAMLEAMDKVLAGEGYFSDIRVSRFAEAVDTKTNYLSERQKQVLQLVAEGGSNKLVARKLDISDNTVKVHIQKIFKLLDVSTRMVAVDKARGLGEII